MKREILFKRFPSSFKIAYLCRLICGILKHLKEYSIPFSGLNPGKHQFYFDIGSDFFESFGYEDIRDSQLRVDVVLDKQANMLVAEVKISGFVELTCDVCLQNFKKDTLIEEQLVVKFQDADIEELTDDIMILGKNDHELPLGEFLYEHIVLSIPPYLRCSIQEGLECDEDMIKVLQKLAPQEEKDQVDPRWAALKNITKNN